MQTNGRDVPEGTELKAQVCVAMVTDACRVSGQRASSRHDPDVERSDPRRRRCEPQGAFARQSLRRRRIGVRHRGVSNPTFTIIALSIRLAEHLRAKLAAA